MLADTRSSKYGSSDTVMWALSWIHQIVQSSQAILEAVEIAVVRLELK